MPHPRKRPTKLGFFLAPLVLFPVVFAAWPPEGARFFVLAGAICFAAPAAGFWWGEMKGDTEAGRAALGCGTTLGLLFGAYGLWAFVVARWIFGWLRFPSWHATTCVPCWNDCGRSRPPRVRVPRPLECQ